MHFQFYWNHHYNKANKTSRILGCVSDICTAQLHFLVAYIFPSKTEYISYFCSSCDPKCTNFSAPTFSFGAREQSPQQLPMNIIDFKEVLLKSKACVITTLCQIFKSFISISKCQWSLPSEKWLYDKTREYVYVSSISNNTQICDLY